MHSTGSAPSLVAGRRLWSLMLRNQVPVTSGVHQGSVLGPILFFININDLPDELASKVQLFADDMAVYLTIGGEDDSNMLHQD